MASEICYAEGKQKKLPSYLSWSLGEVAFKEDKKEKHVIEQYFCEYAKQESGMIELDATIGGRAKLKHS